MTQTRANKITKTNKTNKQENKPSTVAPELVTLDCSPTHVLQVPKTQTYHSQ